MTGPPPITEILDAIPGLGRRPRGNVATYIPELATVDPDLFAVATCELDGTLHSRGHATEHFTIQSICKPILYATALGQFGAETVHRRVGVEPTGEAFNAFTHLESRTNRPRNPLVNAGAIAIADLLIDGKPQGQDPNVRILDTFSPFLGHRTVDVDLPVYLSERSHGRRNRVIAHLMKYHGMIQNDVDTVLDAYYTACSLSITCQDLAVIGATLANQGVHPITNKSVIAEGNLGAVLTLMTTCGMYDASGRFAQDCGVPAKSGVSGGIMAVHRGHRGIGAFSPRLDADGNSVAGWRALRSYTRTTKAYSFSIKPARVPEKRAIPYAVLEEARRHALAEAGGEPPSYLPPVDTAAFACAICSVEGQEVHIGDVESRVALQSAANPVSYGLALSMFGRTAVNRVVGVEASGNPFHAILYDKRFNKPYNPLSNAGALAVAGLSETLSSAGALKQWLGCVDTLVGRDTATVDVRVLEAEYDASNRNRAIANFLVELGIVENPDRAIDLYLQQCATTVTIRDAACLAATLAHGGRHPATNKRAFSEDITRHITTVMYTCGMHDESGQFAFDIGIPSKSGNSGIILSVVPGRMGIALYSPPIDVAGTSVRGRRALEVLSDRLQLGVFG